MNRLPRKRLDSLLEQLNSTAANTAGSRAGQTGSDVPAFELMPSKYFGFFDDFLVADGSTALAQDEDMAQGSNIDGTVWRTNIDASDGGGEESIKLDNSQAGGVVVFTISEDDNDEHHMTAINHGFALDATSAREVWWTCRIKTGDISETGFFIGLASAAGSEETDGNDLEDAVGFYIVDGAASAALQLLTAVGDTETSTDLDTTVVDDTYMTLGFHFDGTGVDAYVNGVKKASAVTSNLPTDGTILFPAIHVAARAASVSDTVSVDYIRACQER